MEIRRCRSCQFIGAQAARVEGVRGVQHEEDVETNVLARPRGGFTAMARSDAAHGDAVPLTVSGPLGMVSELGSPAASVWLFGPLSLNDLGGVAAGVVGCPGPLIGTCSL
jgi:hypothetical protein